MRRSISKIPYRLASFSTTTGRGRDFIPTNPIDPSSEKPNVGTPHTFVKAEEEAKSKPLTPNNFGVFSANFPAPQSQGALEPTKVVSSDPAREQLSNDVKLPTSRREVLEFLRELLEKQKHWFMAERGIKSQEEWEETVEVTLKRLTMMKDAPKKEKEKLQRIAETLPASTPAFTKCYIEQVVLDLQSNSSDCWVFDDRLEFVGEFMYMFTWCISYMDRLYEDKLHDK